jgi:hypothetical protein
MTFFDGNILWPRPNVFNRAASTSFRSGKSLQEHRYHRARQPRRYSHAQTHLFCICAALHFAGGWFLFWKTNVSPGFTGVEFVLNTGWI